MHKIDQFLNNITMYRLLLYGLGLLVAIGAVFGFTDVLSISGFGLLGGALLLMATCYGTNRLLAHGFGAAPNKESSLITALILACLLAPPTTPARFLAAAAAGLIAMAAKYILAIHRKHIFNPAAVAALIASLLGIIPAVWWIGSPSMLPFTLIFGVLVLRKIHRFRLFFAFAITALLMMVLVGALHDLQISYILKTAILSWPLVFLGSIMLTEPATMPSTTYYQLLFGILVGTVYASQLHVGSIATTPQLALVIGNLFAYVVNPRRVFKLRLKAKVQQSPQIYDFVFEKPASLRYRAGQYLEWTLPHRHGDGRGNRRTFTIASSPTEPDLHLGIKFYEPASSFKRTLQAMTPGQTITAGQLSGDFTLPRSSSKELIFIAGGVGITPFRSMLKYLVDSGQKPKLTLYYLVANPEEVAYKDILQSATDHGCKIVPILTNPQTAGSWPGYIGGLSTQVLTRETPTYKDSLIYISGPNAMVQYYHHFLLTHGTLRSHLKTDYFPGY